MSGTRKVVTRSPHRRVGYIACPWFQSDTIEYESLLERDYVRTALLDPENQWITSQPFTLELEPPHRRYIPDFLLRRPNQKLVVEVKPQELAQSNRYRARFAVIGKILADAGYEFIVVTEETVRADRLHERAGLLLRYARSVLPVEVARRTVAIALNHPDGITINDLAAAAGIPTSTVLHLVGRRLLRIDPSLYMDGDRKVYPVGSAQ